MSKLRQSPGIVQLRTREQSRLLLNIPFLGRIPIDPNFVECDDAGGPFLQKYPESEVAEACNLIIEKIMGGDKYGQRR